MNLAAEPSGCLEPRPFNAALILDVEWWTQLRVGHFYPPSAGACASPCRQVSCGYAVRPPSTIIRVPVMYEASGPTRKDTRAATSSGLP